MGRRLSLSIAMGTAFLIAAIAHADYTTDPIRRGYAARSPYPSADLQTRVRFASGPAALTTAANARSLIRVKLLDGRRLTLRDGQPAELTSIEPDEEKTEIFAVKDASIESATWMAATSAPEEQVVADWRNAEAYWQSQLPDPRTFYTVEAPDDALQSLAASISRLSIVEYVDIVSVSVATDAEAGTENPLASPQSGIGVEDATLPSWMTSMKIDRVHRDRGLVGLGATFVQASVGVPQAGSGAYPGIAPFSAYGPFSPNGGDNAKYTMSALGVPQASLGCVRVTSVADPTREDFAGGLGVLIGNAEPLVYASGYVIVFPDNWPEARFRGLTVPMEWDRVVFDMIRILTGAGKTVVEHIGISHIDLCDPTQYPTPTSPNFRPFIEDSGAILVAAYGGQTNFGACVRGFLFTAPQDVNYAQHAIGISATLVLSALRQAGRSVPGGPPVGLPLSMRDLSLFDADRAIKQVLAGDPEHIPPIPPNFPKPTLRVQEYAPRHTLLVRGGSKFVDDTPATVPRIHLFRVYNDGFDNGGANKLEVTPSVDVLGTGDFDRNACTLDMAPGDRKIASGKGSDLVLTVRATRIGDYTCRIHLDTNDERIPLDGNQRRRWSYDIKFRVPAVAGSHIKVTDFLGNVVESGKVFDFGTLERVPLPEPPPPPNPPQTPVWRTEDKVLQIHNESWAREDLKITVPAFDHPRFYLRSAWPPFGLLPGPSPSREYTIAPDESKTIFLSLVRNAYIGNPPEIEPVENDLIIRTNDRNQPEFRVHPKAVLRQPLEKPFEVVSIPHGNHVIYGDVLIFDLGQVQASEYGLWLNQTFTKIKNLLTGANATFKEYTGQLEAWGKLFGKGAKDIGKFTELEYITAAGQVVDFMFQITVQPPGTGRFFEAAQLKFTVPNAPEKAYYVYFTGTFYGGGPSHLSVLGEGGTLPVRSGPITQSAGNGTVIATQTPIPVAGTLAFGRVQQGAFVVRKVTLQNSGTTAMTIRDLLVTGPFSADPEDTTIPAGGSITLDVTLHASASEPAAGVLSFYVDGTGEADNFYSMSLSGEVCNTTGCGASMPIVNSFNAAPWAVAPGQASTLSWNVENATSVSIAPNIGTVAATGSRTVSPSATTEYTLTATNGSQTTTSRRTVLVVGDGPAGSPAISSFTATPSSMTAGQSSTLRWSVSGADSVTVDPGGSVTGTSLSVSPGETTTYVLSASNSAGVSTRVVTVTIAAAATQPVPAVYDWTTHTVNDFSTIPNGPEVVVSVKKNRSKSMLFTIKNGATPCSAAAALHLLSPVSVTGTGFRLEKSYHSTGGTVGDLLTVNCGLGDAAAIRVQFTGKPNGTYPGVVKIPMWGGSHNTPPYDWQRTFEIHIKVISGTGRKRVAQGATEVDNDGGFDADAPTVFSIENTGDASLALSDLAVPAHYRIASPLPSTLAPGQVGSFALERLGPAASEGPHYVSFSSDDADEPVFRLRENHKPVAMPDSIATVDGVASIDVTNNDTDADGDGLSLTENPIVVLPTKGTAAVIDEDTIVYTANAGATGSDRIVYEISDGNGGTAQGEVLLTIGTANRNPTANPDSATTKPGRAVTINVLANDTDPDGDAIQLISDPVVVLPAHGTAIRVDGASITYTPGASFTGVDTFTYEIGDGFGKRARAVVTVTVSNTRPVAMPDSVQTRRNETVTFNVTDNDSDADGDAVFLLGDAFTVLPGHGTAVRVDDHRIRYTPTRSFVGTDTLTYEIGDGYGLRATAEVTIEVVNSGPPAARNDHAVTKRDTPVTIDVLANDEDIDGQTIVLTANPVKTVPRHGTAARISNTSIRYTPDDHFAGNDVFEYEIVDASGNKDRAWVAVHVGRTRSLPVAVDDTAATTVNQSLTINVLANDSSPDGEPIALTGNPFIQRPLHGTVRRISDTVVGFTPQNNWTGTVSFAYEISDTEGGTAAAFVTIAVTAENHPPAAVNDTASSPAGAPVTIDVAANDSDPDGDPLSLTADPIVVAPSRGTASRVSATRIAYAPQAGSIGSDSFRYEISDGHGGTAQATVTITITDTNHQPEAVDDDAGTTTGVSVTIDVTANDFDIDGDTVSLITNPIVTPPVHGTAVKVSGTSIVYTPAAGYTGTDRFQYEIGDHNGSRARAWVDVTIGASSVNHNPVAVDDAITTHESTSVNVIVTANDSDPDGDPVILSSNAIRFAPAHGTAVRLNDTTIKYTPENDFVGVDPLQYEITDGRGKRARAWVRVTVNNSNSRPVAVNDAASTASGTLVTVNVTANDSDPDGNVVRLTSSPIEIAPAHGTATKIDADSIRYVPDAGFQGTDRFKYEIGDGYGGRDRAWVNITVVSAPHSGFAAVALSTPGVTPVAGNDLSESATDTAVPIVVLANDYALNGRPVILTSAPILTPPLSGTVQRSSDTTLTYTPAPGFRGNDRFEYEAIDSDGMPTKAWVTVQVPGDNHPPVAANDAAALASDGTVALLPLLNDTDADGDTIVLTGRAVVIAPLHGAVRRDSDARLIYSAEPGFSGTDTLVYEITDGRGGMAQGTIVISAFTGQHNPVAGNDAATVDSGKSVRIDVLANDTDADGDALRVISSQPPVYGSIVWDENGAAVYQSHVPYVGQDTFRYTVADSLGNTSSADVTVTVRATNYPPVAANDAVETTTRTPVLVGVLANDWDANYGQRLIVASVTQPARGSVVINANRLSVTYTPANDFAGADAFQYTVSDGIAAVTASVTVNVINHAPVPHSEILAAPEDTWVGFQSHNVLGNDFDEDGDELHIVRVEQPAYGTFNISPDQSQFSYKSRENWSGLDSFYYTVSDPFGAEVRVFSQISVAPVNDSPVANNDAFSVYKNQLLSITEQQIVANDTDIEAHTISLYSVGAATNGTTRLENGVVEYQPYGEFVGTDSFEYIIQDSGGGAYGTGRVTVTVLQDTPPVANFTFTCTNLTCSFDASASTDDRGIVLYQWTLGNNNAANGRSFTYTYGAAGSYLVRLTVQDVLGQPAAVTKSVTVTCALPSITAQPTSRAINAGQSTTLSVTATGAASYQWYQGAAPSTTTPVGTNSNSLTVTPAASTSYWVNVTNVCGSTSSQTATVTVCQPPAIATHPVSQTISNGATAILSVVAAGSGPLSYQWFEGTSGTTTVPVGTNSSTFTTPVLTATKSYWVRVTSACNGSVAVHSSTATITVTATPLARRQFAAATANSQLSITGSWTQPTQAGTLLVAVISASSSSYPIANFTTPSGFQLAASYEWNNIKTSIYYYPNNPGGRSTESFGTGGAFMYRDMILQLIEYTGASTVSPLDRTAFNGNNSADGWVDTGYTLNTQQPKEVVLTALTSYAVAAFASPSQGFVKLDERVSSNRLTTAVHERIVSTTGSWGHSAQVDSTAQWVGLVVTFK